MWLDIVLNVIISTPFLLLQNKDFFPLRLPVTFEAGNMMNFSTFALLCFIKLIRNDAWSELYRGKKYMDTFFFIFSVYLWNHAALLVAPTNCLLRKNSLACKTHDFPLQ